MSGPLFKPTSPLMGWCMLMDVIAAGCIGAYWYDMLHRGIKPWDHIGLGAVVTVLFAGSNALLFRNRRWAVIGFIVCGLLLVLLMLPTA